MLGIGIGLSFQSQPGYALWKPLPSDLTASPWATGNVTTASGQDDPNGGTSASRISEAATTAFHYAIHPNSGLAVANTTFFFAVSLKAGTQRYAYAHIFDGTASRGGSIDLQTGTRGTPYNGGTSSAVSLGSGWYRLTISCPMGASPTLCSAVVGIANSNGNVSYAGNTSNNIYAHNPILYR